jgi:hypothetical protein
VIVTSVTARCASIAALAAAACCWTEASAPAIEAVTLAMFWATAASTDAFAASAAAKIRGGAV